MSKLKFLTNLLVLTAMAFVYAAALAVSPIIPFSILLIAGVAVHLTKKSGGITLFSGLAPEVWLPMVKENFYPSNSFLSAAQDLSSLVNNDKINFAEAGADPNVLKNNTTYPINVNVAGDTPKAIELDYYDTDSSLVRNAVAVELSYDQRMLYANKHKKALLKKLGMDAAFAYAPTQHDTNNFNTVLEAGSSLIDAIIDLQKAYNDYDDDGTGRNLVLCPAHMAQIAKEDKVLYKSIMAEAGAMYYGFKIFTYSKTPIYIISTKTKAAMGVAFVEGTHKNASFSFLSSEVMKAQGTFEMFSSIKDPNQKGDIFNFQMRALVSSLRNKYAGAILK